MAATPKTVTGLSKRPDGTIYPYPRVRAVLNSPATVDGTTDVVSQEVTTTGLVDGTWSLTLYANADLTPAGTVWNLSGDGVVAKAIQVPSTAGPFNNLTIMVSPIPSPGPWPNRVSTLTVDGAATFTAGPVVIGTDPGGAQLLRVGGTSHFSGLGTFDNGITVSAGAVSLAQGGVALNFTGGSPGIQFNNTTSLTFYNSALSPLLSINGGNGLVTANFGLTVSAGGLSIGGSNSLVLYGAAATNRLVYWATGVMNRWGMGLSINAESGGNAGAEFQLYRYNDAGSFLDTTISVSRATGLVTLADGLTISTGGLTVGAGGATITGSTQITGDLQRVGGLANYVTIVGAATAAYPTVTVNGTDTDIGLYFSAKGAGGFFFTNNLRVTAGGLTVAAGGLSVLAGGITVGGTGAIYSNGPSGLDFRANATGAGQVSFGYNQTSTGVTTFYGGSTTALLTIGAGATGIVTIGNGLTVSAGNITMSAATGRFDYEYPSAANDADTYIGRFGAGTDATLGPLLLDTVIHPSATAGNRFVALRIGDNTANRTFKIADLGGALSLGNNAASGAIGFYGTTPVAKQTVTGSKGANAALTSLMAALAAMGLVTDTTT